MVFITRIKISFSDSIQFSPQEVAQLTEITPNETEITSLNFQSLLWIHIKKKKNQFKGNLCQWAPTIIS
jgi:hypothetical protein